MLLSEEGRLSLKLQMVSPTPRTLVKSTDIEKARSRLLVAPEQLDHLLPVPLLVLLLELALVLAPPPVLLALPGLLEMKYLQLQKKLQMLALPPPLLVPQAFLLP
jgi:hypothetical protein